MRMSKENAVLTTAEYCMICKRKNDSSCECSEVYNDDGYNLPPTNWDPIKKSGEDKIEKVNTGINSESENLKIYEKAIIIYGQRSQVNVAIEEMSELTKELCKLNRGRDNKSEILEEIYQIGETLNDDIRVLIQNGIHEGVFKDDLSCLPTGLIHWAALSGIVSLAGKKQEYVSQRTGMSRNEFMKFGFQMMLKSILKGGVSID